jgi:hypothetical protein
LPPYLISSTYVISDTASIGDINKMADSTQFVISHRSAPVGRPRINEEQTPARFPGGTLARIDAVLEEGEKRSDFIRDAVDRELRRREKSG